MNDTAEPTLQDPAGSTKETTSTGGWKIQFAVLCAMLVMALVGMGLSQAMENGAWEYWFFVVLVYAGLGLWRSTRKARSAGKPVTQMIGRELTHWGLLLGYLFVLVLLERREIVDREAASDFALLLLAFSCCLAGLNFDWLLLIVGVVLTAMLIAMATLEQYSIVLWVVMLLVAAGAAAFFYFRARRGGSSADFD